MFNIFETISDIFYFPGIENVTSNSSAIANTMSNTYEIGASAILPEFIEINRGAVKIVWVKRSSIQSTNEIKKEDNHVYYTAVDSATGEKERELKAEFKKMQIIAYKLSSQSQSLLHLFIKAEEQTGANRINQVFTLKVDRASLNFEKKLCNSNTSLAERIVLGSHLLKSFANLHHADFAHGDIKPENCLILEKENKSVLKLADFGKAEELPGHKTAMYKGNTRFAPPEGILSKKGDVYGAALILIRNFEEACLKNEKETSLLGVDENNFDMLASSEFRGIEKYVVEHKAFLACNEGLSLDEIRRRIQMSVRSQGSKQEQIETLHHYIDALQNKLLEHQCLSVTKAEDLCDLIKQMTHLNPDHRISASEAEKRYQFIFYDDLFPRKGSVNLINSEE